MDGESEVTDEKSIEGITEEMIEAARKEFIGKLEQIPPMYSAVKHKGKPLYKYAREGKEVRREPRTVHIHKFNITNIDLPEIHFDVVCSKGTYIRALANDFGDKLNVGAYLSKLRRDRIGEYSVDDSFTLDEFRDFYFNLSLTT
jgi:tRNA pseudouridine55 synthase